MDKRKLLIPLLVLMTLVVVGPVAAQTAGPVEATLTAPDTGLTVGDPIELTLSVKHPAGTQVIMPDLGSEWGDFVVQSQSPPVTIKIEEGGQATGMDITSQVIDVRLFAPGAFETPPVTVTVTDGSGQVGEVVAQPATVNITSVLIEGDTALRDIKPQAELPFINLLPWIAGGLIAALVGAIIFFIVRRQRALRALAAVDNRLPHEVALDELDRIEGLALPDAGRFKEHYSLVSDCMRSYMEKRFDVPMLERTTAEIQSGLKQASAQPQVTGQFLSLLDISDLVKFSKYRPEAKSAYGLLTSARQIVQATIPAEADSPTEKTQGLSDKPNLPVGPEPSANGSLRQTEVRA